MDKGYSNISIGEKTIVVYNKFTGDKAERKYNDKSKANLAKQYKSTKLTDKSAKKIKKIIYHWSQAVELSQEHWRKKKLRRRSYMILVTLTLSSKQKVSDNVITNKLLNSFLTRVRQLNPQIHYLWVAEKQKNGNIHYHIIFDRYLDKFWIQRTWNKCQATLHFINEFEEKYKHRNPPSTHVRGQNDMNCVSEYLTKYVTKAEGSLPITSKKWGSSLSLVQLSHVVLKFKKWYIDEFSYYAKYFDINVYAKDFFTVYFFNKNFHKAFKFTAVFSDLESQLRYYYGLLYDECKGIANIVIDAKKIISPPPATQLQLSFC